MKLPDSISELIHLRYVRFDGCRELEDLSESLCELYNLQTLHTEDMHQLERLPGGMSKLIILRHLHLLSFFTSTISGIGKPTSLQELRYFRVYLQFGARSFKN